MRWVLLRARPSTCPPSCVFIAAAPRLTVAPLRQQQQQQQQQQQRWASSPMTSTSMTAAAST